MGLNLNVSLLKEGATERIVTSYPTEYTNKFFTENDVLEFNLSINQLLREASMQLVECEEYQSVLTEGVGEIFSAFKQKVVEIIKAIGKAIKKAWEFIIGKLEELINKIKSLFSKNKKRPAVIEQMPAITYNDYLQKACDRYKPTIMVASITPTVHLLDDDFPNETAISSDLVTVINTAITNTLSNCRRSVNYDDIYDDTMASLTHYVEGMRDDTAHKLFGLYYQLSNGRLYGDFVKKIANDAFGETTTSEKEVNVNLYLQAIQNKETYDSSRVNQIENYCSACKSSCNKSLNLLSDLLTRVNGFQNEINKVLPSNNRGYDPYSKSQRTGYNEMIGIMRRLINITQEALNANIDLFTHKILRINQVYVLFNQNIIDKCDSLVLKYLKDDNRLSTAPVIKESIDTELEANVIYEAFEEARLNLEESYNEELYNTVFDTYLNEIGTATNPYHGTTVTYAHKPDSPNGTASSAQNAASSGGTQQQNQQASQPNQQTQNQQNQQQNQQKFNVSKKNAFLKWMDGIIDAVKKAIMQFQQNLQQKEIATNAGWYNNNRARFQQIDMSKKELGEWVNYDIETLTNKSTFVDWNPNDPMIDSDENMQNAILKNIGNPKNTVQKGDKTKFADRVKNMYITGVTDKAKMPAIATVGFDQGKMFAFLDEVFKNNGQNIFGAINQDFDKLDNVKNTLKNQYDTITQQQQATPAANTGQPTRQGGNNGSIGQSVLNAGGSKTSGQPQTVSSSTSGSSSYGSSLREDSLISIFGLNPGSVTVLREFIVNKDQSAKAAGDPTGGANSTSSDVLKSNDDKLKRYINFNSIAITARLTCLMKAYKQYIALLKTY